eukprot:s944_g2.t1
MGMFNVDQRSIYQLSEATRNYDVFLSHDWRSSGRLKVLTLLIVFNSQAAFLASLAVSAIVGVLRAGRILPDEMWTVIFGHITFVLVLVFWQTIRLLFRRKLLVFLDKLCIDQSDAELKQRGILNLPGFLLSSEKLLILWSEHYFSRLWCVFEMATYLKDPFGRERTQIIPVKTGALLCLSSACWYVLCAAYNVISANAQVARLYGDDVLESLQSVALPAMSMVAFAGVVVVPIVYYVGIGLTEEVEKLPQQLASFNIRDASTSCCGFDHLHPVTGVELPCDRTIIFEMLVKWYADAAEGTGKDTRWTQEINSLIRGHIGSVMSDVRQRLVPINYTIYMVGAANVPFLADLIPELVRQIAHGGLQTISLRFFVHWAFVVVVSIFNTRISVSIWKWGLALQNTNYRCFRSRVCVVALMVPCGCLLASVVWMSHVLCYVSTDDTSLLPLLPFALLLAATIVVLFPPVSSKMAATCLRCLGLHQAEGECPADPDILDTGHGFDCNEIPANRKALYMLPAARRVALKLEREVSRVKTAMLKAQRKTVSSQQGGAAKVSTQPKPKAKTKAKAKAKAKGRQGKRRK